MWRYSRIADLDLDDFALTPGPAGSGSSPSVKRYLDVLGEPAAVLIIDNGHLSSATVAERYAGRLVAGRVADVPDGEALLGSVAGPASDLLGELNDAFAVDPVLVDIPAGLTVDGPIVIAQVTSGDGTASFPRTIVRAGADSDAAVLELQCSTGATLTVPVLELLVDRAARLGHLSVQDLDLAGWQIAAQIADVEADATFRSATAVFGGDYARLRTDCRLVGRGATGDLLAVYFGEGGQTLDFRTFQNHIGPDTTSNLLFKGAVGGRSRSVYTGLIKVEKEARGTNAFQTNRNIKLSEHAWAESVPNLQIETNDVKCSHASAVGPVDEDQRFYLESRGVPTDVAERLIVTGFFDEVLVDIAVPAVAPLLRESIAGKFERREEA